MSAVTIVVSRIIPELVFKDILLVETSSALEEYPQTDDNADTQQAYHCEGGCNCTSVRQETATSDGYQHDGATLIRAITYEESLLEVGVIVVVTPGISTDVALSVIP